MRKRANFVGAWLRSPLKIGAIVPSSRRLARAMARQVDTSLGGTVIELGAGTGVVTHALIASGIALERLVVVEREPRLFAIVQHHFPMLRAVRADASELDVMLTELQCGAVDAIVSSLPLLSMPKAVREAIVRQMAAAISRHGRIVQFTYGAQSPITPAQQRRYGIYGKRRNIVLANVPPAHVWVYKRDRRAKIRTKATKR